jgi:hypothetical protein
VVQYNTSYIMEALAKSIPLNYRNGESIIYHAQQFALYWTRVALR